MKTAGMRRALMLANVFNLLVAIYFIIISIVSLVQLRWYHQLTITIRVRHFVTSATSYFAFLILIFAALVLIVIFFTSTVSFSPRSYVNPSGQDAINLTSNDVGSSINTNTDQPHPPPPPPLTDDEHEQISLAKQSKHQPISSEGRVSSTGATHMNNINRRGRAIVFKDSIGKPSQSSVCCSILLHLISSVSLVVILVIWLLNTGELVRDSISTQLDAAFLKYQFANRSNHYSIAIDGMQDINNCCGSLDYTDFPHQRFSGLSGGHYPGSCCGKNIFGVNARVICTPEEIYRAKQTVSNVYQSRLNRVEFLLEYACYLTKFEMLIRLSLSPTHIDRLCCCLVQLLRSYIAACGAGRFGKPIC